MEEIKTHAKVILVHLIWAIPVPTILLDFSIYN
jgi:hypothetical protein